MSLGTSGCPQGTLPGLAPDGGDGAQPFFSLPPTHFALLPRNKHGHIHRPPYRQKAPPPDNRPWITVRVDGHQVEAKHTDTLMDTGSMYTIFNHRVAERLGLELVPCGLDEIRVHSASGDLLTVLGTATCSFVLPAGQDHYTKPHTVLVVKDFAIPCLLGMDVLKTSNLVLDFKTGQLRQRPADWDQIAEETKPLCW